MNSEHISYKSTRKYLKKLYTKGEHVVQGPGENAGIIDIGDGYCLAMRIESHNHPVFIDPYQGAYRRRRNNERYIYHGSKTDRYIRFLTFWK